MAAGAACCLQTINADLSMVSILSNGTLYSAALRSLINNNKKPCSLMIAIQITNLIFKLPTNSTTIVSFVFLEEQVDFLMSKNQVLQILYLKHRVYKTT